MKISPWGLRSCISGELVSNGSTGWHPGIEKLPLHHLIVDDVNEGGKYVRHRPSPFYTPLVLFDAV